MNVKCTQIVIKTLHASIPLEVISVSVEMVFKVVVSFAEVNQKYAQLCTYGAVYS